jgi:hypothetical protein
MVKLVVYLQERKTAQDYAYVQEGRPGNPTSLHPQNYRPTTTLDLPQVAVDKLRSQDKDALADLTAQLKQRGIGGRVQVREALGGVGAGRHISVQAGLRSGAISTEGRGFRVLLRDLDL